MWEVEREWYQAAKDLHFGLKLLSGLLIILFFTACFVRDANAAVVQSPYDGVVWGIGVVEKPNGSSMESYNPIEGCIVNAPNEFSAACFAVGGNPATLTSDQKALLSNAATGGDFYTFCQNFANYGGSFDAPDDWYVPKFYDVWNMLENLYGDDLYAATFSSAQLRGAKADYQTILNDGSLGGGSSGGSGYIPPSETFELVEKGGWIKTTTEAEHKHFYVNASKIAGLHGSSLSDYSYGVYIMYGSSTSYSTVYCALVLSDRPITYAHVFRPEGQQVNTYGNFKITFRSPEATKWCVATGGSFVWQESNTIGTYTFNQSLQSSVYNTAMNYELWVSGYAISASPSDTVVPPTNWPDNPTVTAPEPPELPDPHNPIIDEQPIDPTPPQNPVFPPITIITEETYTADLQGILDAMDAHCQHLRSALHMEISNLWTVLSTKMTNDFSTFRSYMTGQIGWLGDLISDELESTRDYMQQLAEWLAEQFDYSFTGTAYDDNTLISWLRKIYYRLGSGGVNTRPVDPVANPVDAGDWLSQLIANLFTALNALAGGLLTSVGSALDLMHTKFPFSLPWDLLAILALFEAPPTAPDFDVPIYTLSSVGQLVQVGSWEIDLSDLSPYLEGVRWMQKICFVYFLAVHTKDWMDTLEKVVG